ncbi:peptidoglycan-binding protein [Aerosakkonemataceae cyanobacterium BLCC-F50]|uniref:Peptidoglycan-binding protein n=1 Tax=Floridaenema flaviceps BLCC-F50 TaxID=3153642 RepID=A0ABV4XU07_9CYAN
MQVATSASFRSLSVLRRGSTGEDVSLLQQRLNATRNIPGVGLTTLVVDGIFGVNTERAVRHFQEVFTLTIDGVVGLQTWASLIRISLPDDLSPPANFNVRSYRVIFASTTTSAIVNNSAVREDFDVYVVNARARQQLLLDITSSANNAVVNAIVTPDNQQLTPGRDDILRFPVSGDYLILIGKNSGNANYQLQITIR